MAGLENVFIPPADPDVDEQRREKLWKELRYLHALIESGRCERRGASVENVLWEVQSELDRGVTGIARPLFVSLLVNAFGFERRCGVEKKLWRMYDNFDSVAGGGHLDWRELVCALHGLANPAHAYNNPLKLLSHFWRVYALSSPDNSVSTEDVYRIVSMAAVSRDDVARTRGVLRVHLAARASRTSSSKAQGLLYYGGGGGSHRLNSNKRGEDELLATRMVGRTTTFEDFASVLEGDCPSVVEAFRSQLWAQLTDQAKLTYLRLEEEESSRWFEAWMVDHNRRKALGLPQKQLLRRSMKGWKALVKKWRVVTTHRRFVVIRNAQRAVRWWATFVALTRGATQRRRAADGKGARALCRRILLRWRRWAGNEVRARTCCGGFNWSIPAAHAAYLVRMAEQRWRKRLGLAKWKDWLETFEQFKMTRLFALVVTTRRHFHGWRDHLRGVKRLRDREVEAVSHQVAIAEMAEEAARIVTEEEAAARGLADEATRAAEASKMAEKRHRLAWQTRRRQAERAADDRLKMMLQHEARQRRVAEEKEQLAHDFEEAWALKERDYIDEKKRATVDWLKSKLAKPALTKEFKRIEREHTTTTRTTTTTRRRTTTTTPGPRRYLPMI